MKTFIAPFLASLAVGTFVSVTAQQPTASDLLTATQVRQLIASAQPADHVRLRTHFDALAARYTADAARHATMGRAAGGNPNRRAGGDPSAHHNRLAALAKESAGITRELATHHGQLATGVASTAPRDSARFEQGAGAPSVPSEKQLLDLAAKARTASEHGELVEYYQKLATQYSTDATDHSTMAAAYRGTKSGTSMASHCDRLVQIAREEAKEATALAADHKQMAVGGR